MCSKAQDRAQSTYMLRIRVQEHIPLFYLPLHLEELQREVLHPAVRLRIRPMQYMLRIRPQVHTIYAQDWAPRTYASVLCIWNGSIGEKEGTLEIHIEAP